MSIEPCRTPERNTNSAALDTAAATKVNMCRLRTLSTLYTFSEPLPEVELQTYHCESEDSNCRLLKVLVLPERTKPLSDWYDCTCKDLSNESWRVACPSI